MTVSSCCRFWIYCSNFSHHVSHIIPQSSFSFATHFISAISVFVILFNDGLPIAIIFFLISGRADFGVYRTVPLGASYPKYVIYSFQLYGYSTLNSSLSLYNTSCIVVICCFTCVVDRNDSVTSIVVNISFVIFHCFI